MKSCSHSSLSPHYNASTDALGGTMHTCMPANPSCCNRDTDLLGSNGSTQVTETKHKDWPRERWRGGTQLSWVQALCQRFAVSALSIGCTLFSHLEWLSVQPSSAAKLSWRYHFGPQDPSRHSRIFYSSGFWHTTVTSSKTTQWGRVKLQQRIDKDFMM